MLISDELDRRIKELARNLSGRDAFLTDDLYIVMYLSLMSAEEGHPIGYYVEQARHDAIDYLRQTDSNEQSLESMMERGIQIDTEGNIYSFSQMGYSDDDEVADGAGG